MADDFTSYAQARQQQLYRTAYLLCGDQDKAQDLVQTTLVLLLRYWKRARKADHPDAYAKKTLVHAFIADRRKQLREADALPLTVRGRAGATADADLRLVVLEALRALPPKPRAIVVLRYWEDLSVEETAALMGCSTGNVKSQCARSLVKLRSLLGERFTDLVAS